MVCTDWEALLMLGTDEGDVKAHAARMTGRDALLAGRQEASAARSRRQTIMLTNYTLAGSRLT